MATATDKLIDAGVKLRNHGNGNHKTTCPRCSDKRKNKKDPCLSVTIEPESIVVHCHNCEWADGFRDDNADYQPYRQQRKEPPKKPMVKPEGELSDAAIKWFAGRGISESTLEKQQVFQKMAWMPGPDKEVSCVCFPYFRNGELVNVKYRSGDKKFRQEKGAEKIFYGLDSCVGKKAIIITEGEIDVLSLAECGLGDEYGILSVPDGAPKEARDGEIDPENDAKFDYVWNCREVIEGAEKVILATDGDGPGQALEAELARRIGKEKCWRVQWPALNDAPRKDANEVLANDGPQILRECIERAQPFPIQSLFEANQFESDVLLAYRGGRERGKSTGWDGVDALMTIVPGQLSVVTGYPASGKSEFIDAMMVNLAKRYAWRFALCSFENHPGDDHIPNLAEKFVMMPFWDGPTFRMTESDLMRGLAWVNDHFTFIRADDESPTIDWLLEKARAAVMRYGIRGLVIDPYNELEHKRPTSMSETEYVSEMLGKVRRFAQSQGVHVWFVAHPAKPPKDARSNMPSLYDISGSANWTNKADIGLVVHRGWDEATGERSRRTTISVKKVKRKWVGKEGSVTLDFNPAIGVYSEGYKRA